MAKKVKEAIQYRCKDCQNAFDFHEKNQQGEFFLCRCKFFKFSRFLNRDWCGKFIKK